MYSKVIAILLFLTPSVMGQTLFWVTNVQGNVASGPAFTLTGPVGSYRITYTVLDTISPYVPVPMDDGSTFRLEIRDIHSFRIYNLTNTLGTDISPANGEIRHVIPSLGAGTYDVRGIATPANGNTNLNWKYTWHTLAVTSTPAQASVTVINSNQIFLAGSTNIEQLVINQYDGGVSNFIGLGGITGGITNDSITIDGSGIVGTGGDLTTLSNDVLGAWATASNAFDLAVIASNLAAVAETDPLWASWLATNIVAAQSPAYAVPLLGTETATAVVNLAKGRYQRISPETNGGVEITILFDAKFSENYVGSLLLSVDATTSVVAFATNYIDEALATNVNFSATDPSSFILYSAAGRTNQWSVYQLE